MTAADPGRPRGPDAGDGRCDPAALRPDPAPGGPSSTLPPAAWADPNVVHFRCHGDLPCGDVVARLEHADRLAAYGLDADARVLRRKAADVRQRCAEAELLRQEGP